MSSVKAAGRRRGHRTAQRMPVKLVNAVSRGIWRLGIEPPVLEAESMCREAEGRTGLDDFGDESFREPLGVLLDSIEREAHLHAVGRHLIRGQIIGRLSARLQMEGYWTRCPEVLEHRIARPLFIFGLPRSGTTFLFYLLAQDPAHRWLSNWEALNSLPPPRTKPDRRRDQAIRSNQLLNWLAPELRRKHPLAADNPAECLHLQQMTFESEYFPFFIDLPTYRKWLYGRNRLAGYRHYRRQIQVLQDQREGERWLLKTPFHIFSVDAVLAVFPDACIVQTHRDPQEALPSSCSLQATLRDVYADSIDHAVLGRETLEHFAYGIDRCMDVRAEAKAEHFFDVDYQTLVRDPMGIVAGIYRQFGFRLTEEASTRMRAYLARNTQHKNGTHRYSLEKFGLEPEAIVGKFRRYIDQFHIPVEDVRPAK
jgi:hypothetical protein